MISATGERGLSLIELCVALTVMAILAALAWPRLPAVSSRPSMATPRPAR